MLNLYNTLTRKLEVFKPIKKNHVSIYTCGPTVYDYAHIGNFRAYISADLLRRYRGRQRTASYDKASNHPAASEVGWRFR